MLLIVGAGRSGSTLLSRILGQIDGFFAVGELAQIWQAGMTQNRMCGCGVRFSRCELWREILERAFGPEGVDAAAMLAEQRHGVRVRQAPLMLFGSRRPGKLANGPYGQRLGRLYATIAAVTGCWVVVDSSKLPLFGKILQTMGAIDLYVVHLVRDPRATAYSWARSKLEPDRRSAGYSAGYMVRFSALKSSALWAVYNAGASVLGRHDRDRYLRLRYEDFVVSPRETVQRILRLVGDAESVTPFIDERTVTLAENHTVLGNPDRLSTGHMTISADVEWLTNLSRGSRVVSTLVTLPALHRLGYPLRPSRGSSNARAYGSWRS